MSHPAAFKLPLDGVWDKALQPVQAIDSPHLLFTLISFLIGLLFFPYLLINTLYSRHPYTLTMYIPTSFIKQEIQRGDHELRKRNPAPEDGSDLTGLSTHPINQVGPSFEAPDTPKVDQDKIAWIVFGVAVALVFIISGVVWYKSIRGWFQRRALERVTTTPGSTSEIVVEKPSQPKGGEPDLFTVVTLPNTPPPHNVTPPAKLSRTTTASQNIDPWYIRLLQVGRRSTSDAQPTVVHVEVERIAEVNGEARTPARWSRLMFSPRNNGSLGFGNSRRS